MKVSPSTTSVEPIVCEIDLSKDSLEKSVQNTLEIETEKSDVNEKWHHVFREIIFPFILAGLGMVGAGILFDFMGEWDLFQNVIGVIALVPALLGLKGNLEMTLAARLSTQVNVGKIHNFETRKSAILGNLAIIQLQSIVVGFLASFVAVLLEFIFNQKFRAKDLPILIGSSVGTASLASLVLGGLIIFLILISNRLRLNPDNIATPIAATLGDLVTLGILGSFGTLLYILRETIWIHYTMLGVFVLLIPVFGFYCYRNEFVKDVLYNGWIPILVAMLISCFAGIILDISVEEAPVIRVYQPIVNGLGGNIVAIFACRLSTHLHRSSKMGKWADWSPKKFILYPIETFFAKKNPESTTASLLMAITLPSHLIFFFIIYFIDIQFRGDTYLTVDLPIFYCLFTFIQVAILLVMGYFLVHIIWRFNKDPDNIGIPLLTATGDLIGVVFLLLCFLISYSLGNENIKAHGHKATTIDITHYFSTPAN